MSEQIEKINKLLDGELDSFSDAALYADLSVDSDLRAEMRDQIAIKNTIQNDRMALVPPAALTNSVFTGLGFAAPLAGAASSAASGGLLLQWFTRLGIPILSAIAAAGVSIVAVQNDSQPAVSNQVAEQVVAESSTPQNAVAGRSENSTEAKPLSNSVVTRPAPSGPSERDLQRQLAILRSENASLRDKIAEYELASASTMTPSQAVEVLENPALVQRPTYARSTPISQVQVTNAFSLSRDTELHPYNMYSTPFGAGKVKYPRMMVQLRGYSLSPTVQTDIAPQSEWYSDLGLGFLYQFSKNHSAGAEIGNETFPMVFEGDRNGQIVRYEQNPSSVWFGLTYRYTADVFKGLPIAPFGQVMLGGSNFGPVGRAAAGLQYAPTGPMSFILGLETSALAYTHQSNWYVSPKFGLTYGMSYNF